MFLGGGGELAYWLAPGIRIKPFLRSIYLTTSLACHKCACIDLIDYVHGYPDAFGAWCGPFFVG